MDKNAFDALVRGLGAGRSRRTALKGLAAGLFGLGIGREAKAQVGGEALVCRQFCDSDADCNAGLRCGKASDQCFAVPDTRKRCNGNSDCPVRYEICGSNGRCQNTQNCFECKRDGDCANADQSCRDGRCVVVKPQCNDDDDCRRVERCENRRCVSRGTCVEDNDCRRNEKCNRNDRCVARR